MLICPNCKHENFDKSKFCSYCGRSFIQPLAEEEQTEQLKEQSRQIALNKTGQSVLEQWERIIKGHLPNFKAYPLLSFIRITFMLIGWLLLIGGFIGILTSLGSAGIGFRQSDAPSTGLGLFLSLGSFMSSMVLLFFGLVSIASSEALKLMIDLQENADHQSILLTMLYQRLSEKQKVDIDQS